MPRVGGPRGGRGGGRGGVGDYDMRGGGDQGGFGGGYGDQGGYGGLFIFISPFPSPSSFLSMVLKSTVNFLTLSLTLTTANKRSGYGGKEWEPPSRKPRTERDKIYYAMSRVRVLDPDPGFDPGPAFDPGLNFDP